MNDIAVGSLTDPYIRHFKMTGPGWQRDDLFEMRDPKPGEDYGQGESLLLFGDVLGTGTIANERYRDNKRNLIAS